MAEKTELKGSKKGGKFYSISREIIFRIIDGEAIIVKPEDSSMLILNETGTFIFETLMKKKKLSFEEILEEVVENFEITKERAKKDITSFITSLKKEKILTIDSKQ